MVIKELQMRMAYPESCFQAMSADECVAAVRDWTSQFVVTNQVSLRGAIQIFTSGSLSPESARGLASLGPLNLFVIVSGKNLGQIKSLQSISDLTAKQHFIF
jgi:hypothetical protein